jgi:hypothetical protein
LLRLKSGRSAVRPLPCPPPLNSQDARSHQARGVLDGNADGKLTAEDRRALSPLFWAHANPYGRFRLDMETRLDLGIAA